MICHLYSINFPNGKKYIGITSRTLAARWKQHCVEASAGSVLKVHIAMRKYGIENITVETLVTGERDYIIDLEIKTINQYETTNHNFGYNTRKGGVLSSQESIELMRAKLIDRVFTDEHREKLSKSAKLRIKTDECRKAISRTLKARFAVTPKVGHARSLETREKISQALMGKPSGTKGYHRTAETKAKMSVSAKLRVAFIRDKS